MNKTQKKNKGIGYMAVFLILFTNVLFAQQTQEVEMADGMYASGKIYVVVAVLSLVFIGIVVYLVNLDRKILKLEKENMLK